MKTQEFDPDRLMRIRQVSNPSPEDLRYYNLWVLDRYKINGFIPSRSMPA